VLGNSSITKIVAKVTSITAISDRRLKKDIAALPADLGLGFIEKLKPVSYRFNDGDETRRYGFIAQDVEQALPASLHDTVEKSVPEHGLAMVERGNDKDRTYRMAYGELTAPMVKAIQELEQENAALRRALSDQAAAFEAALADQAATNDAMRRSMAALREQVTAVKLTRN
jgi:trimeric autotransporter adhesin